MKMSTASRAVARMRILALPLTSGASSSGLHTFYHFQTPPPSPSKTQPSVIKTAMGKVVSVWTGFGKAPEGTWKVNIDLLL